MEWKIERVINFPQDKSWGDGFAHLGFHDSRGRQYICDYNGNWVGLCEGGELLWTVGAIKPEGSGTHTFVDIVAPVYASDGPDGSTVISSNGNKRIYRFEPKTGKAELFIDGDEVGLKDIGNCQYDLSGRVWVNEITGFMVWCFGPGGEAEMVIGDGTSGFESVDVPFDQAHFGWIYDLRLGPDGNIYVLDSSNYAVRMIDIDKGMISLVAGTGEPGYSGDGGSALQATFGHNPAEQFDGPWSLALDEEGNIFVGDTQNHVVRMVDRQTGVISTIAGQPTFTPGKRNSPGEVDPYRLNLPRISSLDYADGRLFIPEWDDDLAILVRK